jgi:8-oxo-dGTP pyrophosphatase MutT (NUDIX family)
LILLYADRRGDLRVVITMRAASLRSFSGHAAFPGGKADDAEETPCEIMLPSFVTFLLMQQFSPDRPQRSVGRDWSSNG